MAEAWGDGQMSALEAIMWRGESASVKSTIVSLELLASTPDWNDFHVLHERVVSLVPRLCERVVEAPWGLAKPRWSVDPSFALSTHLRRVTLPAGADLAQLMDLCAEIATTPFDRTRPPWEAILIEGLPDGRSAYLLKLHHASTDGMGIVQLLHHLHTSTPRRPEPPTEVCEAAGVAVKPLTGLDVLAEGAVGGVASIPAATRRAAGLVRGLVGDPASALAYGRSLIRVSTPPRAQPSSLLAGRGVVWNFAGVDVELGALRRSGKVAGGTLNDAFLAALLGGYRRYHEALGHPVDAVPMSIPISVRAAGDAAGGNRFAGARLSGPVAEDDPARRIRTIGEMVRQARDEPALDHLAAVAPVMAKLPARMLTAAVSGMTRMNDLQASNVPGTDKKVFLAGAEVERLYPFAPLPGCPAMITLISYRDTCCVGVNFDNAAFTDADLFVDSLVEGFAEVLALSGKDAAAPVRVG